MAHFGVPRYVEFVTELPKTPTNRIEKYRLRQLGITDWALVDSLDRLKKKKNR